MNDDSVDGAVDDARRARPVRYRNRVLVTIGEHAGLLAIPATYYYLTTNLQREDFELTWDWPTWRAKLTTVDLLAFDTGNWNSNAIRHPLDGALHYQASRANGYGPVVATVANLASAVVWEYVVEFKERISINDLVINTTTGVLIGEPLFQLGRTADQPGARWPRKLLGWLVSPFDRVHGAAGYPSWRAAPRPWTRFALGAGAGVVGHGHTTFVEGRVGLDLELIQRPYGVPGTGSSRAALGMWNRLVVDVRANRTGGARSRFSSMTTFGGRYTRSIDANRHGTDRWFGLASGLDYETRQLAAEHDRVAVFHLVGPRLALGWWCGERRVSWELAGYGDVGLVAAHVFGLEPPLPPLPHTSVLRTRGYYYAGGLSLASRLTIRSAPWSLELEGRAHAFRSIDGLDRVELHGGEDDPHAVTDQRAFGRAALGVDVTAVADQGRLELAVEAAARRGAWQDRRRRTDELGASLSLVLGF